MGLRLPRVGHPAVIEAGLIALAIADAVLHAIPDWPVAESVADGIAVLALLLRHRHRYLAFFLTLPALTVSPVAVPSLIALYTVARHARDRRVVALCATAVVVADAIPWPPDFEGSQDVLITVIYSVLLGAAPAFLGQLVQARADLSARLREIVEARERSQELLAQTVLAKERAQLAREMHDVVSHQVSLIAVQAAALQVTANPQDGAAARTIRELAVETLDELRHMINLLRASASRTTPLAPQPTLTDLRALVTASGIDATLHGELPDGLDTAAQRAVYRTVQEGLTNVRKHAPGARVAVELWQDSNLMGVTVANGPPARQALSLPSAQHGLIGLRERAELLHGTLNTERVGDGGFRIRLSLPVTQ